MSKSNELKIRVYYEDTDCGNVVYYANYLRYMERGRTELLRDAGIDLAVYHEAGLLFVVVETNVRYKRSARYNDLLRVVTSVKEFSQTTITFVTEIFRDDDDTPLVVGDVKIACVKANGRPGRMPEKLLEVCG